MSKPTQAEKRAKKHADRINSRLANRPLPKFEPGSLIGASTLSGPCIVVATDGQPYRINAADGTVEKMRWAR